LTKEDARRKRLAKRAIFPLVFLLIGLAITIIYNIIFSPRGWSLDGVAFYAALSSTSFILLILFQRFYENRPLHSTMSIGWGLIFVGTYEKLVSDMVDTIGLENENFFSAVIFFGLLLVAVGLFSWASMMYRSERERERQHRVIELYTSLMSHDAGNDLQAVLGYLEVALETCADCEEETVKILEAARSAALRMKGLVQAFKTGDIDKNLPLGELLQKVADQAESTHIGLSVKLNVDPRAKGLLVAGDELLEMAFVNLLRNAAEHAGSDAIANISLSRDDTTAIVILADNGPGIPAEIKDTIFQRGSTKNEHGMGLYLSKQVIVACGGTIEYVDSEPGATFRIVLPAIP
jgi:signal transduction histidine kinase